MSQAEHIATPTIEVTLPVEGMTCATCSARIEKVVNRLDAVKETSVNLASEKAHIVYFPGVIQEQDLIKAVEKPGMVRL